MAISKAALQQKIDDRSLPLLTPLLDGDQVGDGSVDVRLGHQFIVFNKATGFKAIDPSEGEDLRRQLRRHHQSLIRLAQGQQFYLHPGEFVIARTFEYVAMPDDWIAYVAGRSSWGRLGIVIATATFINPSFRGTITLEIANLGGVPVTLVPLMRIAQLIFHPFDARPGDNHGKHQISIPD
jgi:dCTP deaminase